MLGFAADSHTQVPIRRDESHHSRNECNAKLTNGRVVVENRSVANQALVLESKWLRTLGSYVVPIWAPFRERKPITKASSITINVVFARSPILNELRHVLHGFCVRGGFRIQ